MPLLASGPGSRRPNSTLGAGSGISFFPGMSEPRTSIKPERVRSLLNYDPETGIFRWSKSFGPVSKGSKAGTVVQRNSQRPGGGNRYVKIGIDGVKYYAHRLAFLIKEGRWPKEQVDHINGDGTDNRWSNLREVTQAVNSRNATLRADNKTGRTGVIWDKRKQKWRAEIRVDDEGIHLGYFEDFEQAVKAREEAENRYGFHQNHGRKTQDA